jgi:hypothetical protein
VDTSDVADVSEVHVASIFRVDPPDEGSMYLRNVGNIACVHTRIESASIINHHESLKLVSVKSVIK